MSETPPEPPIGELIPIERPIAGDQSDGAGGEHVVITPFTAGSAGAAHKES